MVHTRAPSSCWSCLISRASAAQRANARAKLGYGASQLGCLSLSCQGHTVRRMDVLRQGCREGQLVHLPIAAHESHALDWFYPNGMGLVDTPAHASDARIGTTTHDRWQPEHLPWIRDPRHRTLLSAYSNRCNDPCCSRSANIGRSNPGTGFSNIVGASARIRCLAFSAQRQV